MSLLTVGTVAFDAIETPFGKTDKIVGGAATYIAWSASFFSKKVNIVSVIGDDFDMNELELLKQRGVDTTGIEQKLNNFINALNNMNIVMDGAKVGKVLVNVSDAASTVGVFRSETRATL